MIDGANAADFSIVSDQCSRVSLAPNASCTFGVSFAPSDGGSRTARARFGDVSVALAGAGDGAPPASAFLTPAGATLVGGNSWISGKATDDTGVAAAHVTIRNSATGQTYTSTPSFGCNARCHVLPVADGYSVGFPASTP